MPTRIDIDGVSVSPDHFIGGERVSGHMNSVTLQPRRWLYDIDLLSGLLLPIRNRAAGGGIHVPM